MKYTDGQTVIVIRKCEYYGWKGEIWGHIPKTDGPLDMYAVDLLNPDNSGDNNWDTFWENELVDLSKS